MPTTKVALARANHKGKGQWGALRWARLSYRSADRRVRLGNYLRRGQQMKRSRWTSMFDAHVRSVRFDDFKFRTTNVNDHLAAQCRGCGCATMAIKPEPWNWSECSRVARDSWITCAARARSGSGWAFPSQLLHFRPTGRSHYDWLGDLVANPAAHSKTAWSKRVGAPKWEQIQLQSTIVDGRHCRVVYRLGEVAMILCRIVSTDSVDGTNHCRR